MKKHVLGNFSPHAFSKGFVADDTRTIIKRARTSAINNAG